MAQRKDGPLVVEDARIGMQGTGGGRESLRTRIPGGVLSTLEAQDGEYFHWQVFSDIREAMGHIPEGTPITIGYIISEEDAKPRDLIAEKKAGAKKGGATKSAKKGPAKRPAASASNDPFADDEEEAPVRRVARPVAVAARPAAVASRPTAAPSLRGVAGRHPRREGPLAKPGASRRAKRGGGIRYDTGE